VRLMLEVHKASISACVRISPTAKNDEEPHQEEIRKFKSTTTHGLLELRDWLAAFSRSSWWGWRQQVSTGSPSTTCSKRTWSCGC
jgi:hypothetical protein